jgi:hypothetical protein
MISITRRQARQLRSIFRRSTLGLAHKGVAPPVVLHVEGTQLRAHYRYGALAVEFVTAFSYQPHESIAVPLDALADVEGSDDSPVIVEAVAVGLTVARWTDRGVPQTREYGVPTLDTLDVFPDSPATWTPAAPGLLTALAEACETATEGSHRYALDCLKLQGDTGQIAATDGCQLLIERGFTFPWSGDVLVKRTPVFSAKGLPRDQPVSLGKTDSHVVIRVGPWTFFLEVQTGVRFPDLDCVLPATGVATSRLSLDPGDARFLLPALDRLPGADAHNAPLTIDLNGQVAVRAQGEDSSIATELVLSRSRYTGPSLRFNIDRELLARALRLGFSEVEITDPASPVVCRDASRIYGCQPRNPESAIEPSENVTRIESHTIPEHGSVRVDGPGKVKSLMSAPTPAPIAIAKNPTSIKPDTTGLLALIREAEALQEALSDARIRAGRLTIALRRHRKRERLVASTLATLKQLKLQEVAG